MLSSLKTNRTVVWAVIFNAVVVVLAAFGLLPRTYLTYLAVFDVLFTAILPPKLGLRFFILLLPWFFAVPLAPGYDRFQIWRILIVEIFLLAAQARNFKIPLTKIDWAFFGFLGTGVISLFAADFWEPGLRYITWFFNLYLVFAAGRLVVQSDEDRSALIRTTAFSVLTIVGLGFLQLVAYLFTPQILFWQYWASSFIPVLYGQELARVVVDFNSWFSYFKDSAPGLRMFSLLPGSHYFALVVTLGLAFVLKAREEADRKIKWTWALMLLILSLVLASVRGVWIAAFAPAVALIVFYSNKFINRPDFKKVGAVLAIFATLFLLSPVLNSVLTFISPHDQGIGSLYTRAGSSFDPYETSNNLRLEIWKISWESFKERPLLGLGLGNFPTIFGSGADFDELANQDDPLVGIPKKHLSAHNIFLQVLVETGIVGLSAFLIFLFFIFQKLMSNYRQHQSTWSLFFGLALIWILGQEFFDTSLILNDKTLILFWLGLLLL